MIQIEYLLPFDTSDGICEDIDSFNSLLSTHKDIKIENHTIHFDGSPYDYLVEKHIVPNQSYTVFHVTFKAKKATDKFRKMLKAVKRSVGEHVKDKIQIIWDGVGFKWSQDLYPKIYEIENSLRKLMSKFMLIKLGVGWHKSSVPQEVKDSSNNKKSQKKHDILYEVDFIQLSNFLFRPYANKDIHGLSKIIRGMKDSNLSEEKISKIQEYIPRNNWERFFSQVVDIESEQLEKKWAQLYEIRNKVAHNLSLTIEDYKEGMELCEFLQPHIDKAISSISNITVPEGNSEAVSLRTIATMNDSLMPFIQHYELFGEDITSLIESNQSLFNTIHDLSQPIDSFLESSYLKGLQGNESLVEALHSITDVRNEIMSGSALDPDFGLSHETASLFQSAATGILDVCADLDKPIFEKYSLPFMDNQSDEEE